MDITTKSIGMLIDEYITTQLKIEVSPTQENIQRGTILKQTIETALQGKSLDHTEKISNIISQLRIVLRECWNAQEIIMKTQGLRCPDQINIITMLPYIRVYDAAIKAQKTNAARNKLIREIDSILGEQDITILEKTYA